MLYEPPDVHRAKTTFYNCHEIGSLPFSDPDSVRYFPSSPPLSTLSQTPLVVLNSWSTVHSSLYSISIVGLKIEVTDLLVTTVSDTIPDNTLLVSSTPFNYWKCKTVLIKTDSEGEDSIGLVISLSDPGPPNTVPIECGFPRTSRFLVSLFGTSSHM